MQAKARLFGHPIHQMLIVFPLGLLATSVFFDIARLKRSRRQDLIHALEMRRQSSEDTAPPVWRRRWFVRIPVRIWRALRLPEIR